jgi:hypothetical protein
MINFIDAWRKSPENIAVDRFGRDMRAKVRATLIVQISRANSLRIRLAPRSEFREEWEDSGIAKRHTKSSCPIETGAARYGGLAEDSQRIFDR